MLEAAKTGPVTLEVASCARPAPLLNHRPLLRKNPPARVGGIEPPAEVGSLFFVVVVVVVAVWYLFTLLLLLLLLNNNNTIVVLVVVTLYIHTI